MYSLSTNPHPNPKSSNPNNLNINRNPYISGHLELRKDPPKQNPTLLRNSSNK